LAPGKRITAILTLAVNIAFFYFIVIALIISTFYQSQSFLLL
jgi:hypothetical protein